MRPPALACTVVATRIAQASAMSAAVAMTRAPIRYPVGTVTTLGRPPHTIGSPKSESLATLRPLCPESAPAAPVRAAAGAHGFKGCRWALSDHLDVTFPEQLRCSRLFVA